MKKAEPRVSIGLPVYNGEQFLREALDSILTQTFTDFELIISDNSSTDGTEEICREYAAKDQRIRYYRNEQNLGAAGNYNRAFELAKGEYFKWAACDDICQPAFIETCVKVLDYQPEVVLCYPKTAFIDKQGKFKSNYEDELHLDSPKIAERYQQYHRRFRLKQRCNSVFGVMRTSVLRQTPLIGNYAGSDIPLLAELALRGKFYEVPEYLFWRRLHQESSTRANTDPTQLAVWFDVRHRGKIIFPNFRRLSEYLKSIKRVPMSWQERVLCYLEIGRWSIFRWGYLRHDLSVALRQLFAMPRVSVTKSLNKQ
ncbi:MAG: glycosyltransferase family A protein [Coleofasciculaceae cyanobacterium]